MRAARQREAYPGSTDCSVWRRLARGLGFFAVLAGLKLETELGNPNFRVKESVDDILHWQAQTHGDPGVRDAARLAAELLKNWRLRKAEPKRRDRQGSLFAALKKDKQE